MKLKSAGRCLHVAPVTTNVKQISKGERRHLLNVLLQCLSTGPGGERGPTFFPRVTHQTEAVVSYWFAGLRGYEDRIPAGVLLDPEWPLIQTISNLRSWTKVIIVPVVRGNFLRFFFLNGTGNTESRSRFDKATPAHV